MEPVSTFAGISTAIKLASTIKDKVVGSELKTATSELFNVILDLQESVFLVNAERAELLRQNTALKDEITAIQAWKEEKANYELAEVCAGVFVYSSKLDNEPKHWICQKCFNDNRKSILQRTGFTSDGTFYTCHNCNSVICDHSNVRTFSPSPPIKTIL